MESAVKQIILKNPSTFKELGDVLSKYYLYHQFYRAHLVCEDGRESIVFMTNTMKKALKNAREFSSDGTFRVSSSSDENLLSSIVVFN